MHPCNSSNIGNDGEQVNSLCTQICNSPKFKGKSCSKTLLVRVYPEGEQEKSMNVYAAIDDQSNRTLAKSKLFEKLNIKSDHIEYSLPSCSGTVTVNGKQGYNLVMEALDKSKLSNMTTYWTTGIRSLFLT